MLSRRAESVSAALPLYTQEDILALLAWREEAQEVIDLLQPDNFTGAGEVDYRHLARVALGCSCGQIRCCGRQACGERGGGVLLGGFGVIEHGSGKPGARELKSGEHGGSGKRGL